VAEETGLIHEIGAVVCRTVAAQAHEWAASTEGDASDFVVAVNVSGVQLDDPQFASMFGASLEAADVAPERLCVEITETALMRRGDTAQAQLRALRDLGVHLAVDDFGTGYSSLAHVYAFPIETIKIDSSFIARITNDARATRIVRTLIQLSHSLG
jgi:EAL domain-containing protein (putative c-di-GMP-specific phosphodiesterase class I)